MKALVLALYLTACAGTIVDPGLLRAMAIVESGERDDAVGDDGVSVGRFQLNETFHAERARLYGEYDARDPDEAGRIAARILEDNYRRLGFWALAIASYRQGVTGVQRDGPSAWYIDRVMEAME